MNETQKRIAAYKAALPGLKERVLAVALLLAMSVAMLTSASFAWLTISRSPEITNVSTTVAANGNLEIALAKPSGEAPAESAIGDSSAALGQSVVKANLTWGNLVNLSDASYGLSNLVLRPALLGNTNNLLSQPLKGVDYGEDGRAELYYNEDYQFANWTVGNDGVGYFKYFNVPQYGVRAISTIKYTYVNNKYYDYTLIRNQATGKRNTVIDGYDSITGNSSYINALAGLIGDFMTDNLNGSDTDVSGYVKSLYHMMLDVYNLLTGADGREVCFEDALVDLANAQLYLDDPDMYESNPYTRETLLAATTAELKVNGVVLPSLEKYKTLKANVERVLYGADASTNDCIYDYYRVVYPYLVDDTDQVDENRKSEATVKRSDLMKYINDVVEIGSAEITYDGKTRTVTQLSNSKSEATGLLGKSVDAVIKKGYLVDFEQLVGGRLNATNITVKATYIVTVSVKAKTITTDAQQPYEFDKDLESTEAIATDDKGDYTGVAQDTYGMALDFWVRTNSADSYLVLEGNVLTSTSTVRDTGIDMNGNEVDLYTVTISTEVTDEEGAKTTVSEDYAVYQIKVTNEDNTETVTWYYASNHALLYNEDGSAPAGQTISSPIARMKDVVTVIGYEGENRVWDTDDNIFLDSTSTTQGSGSCYVFYAEDPAQQENSLRLLSNLRVAFVDSNEGSATYGKMVAIAKLDVDNRYEENGRVTVPLVLEDDGSTYLTTTEDGLAIMPLKQNTATRLTAIIYLDGREITNAEVLAANDIQGQLNIQFGSSQELVAVSNEKLESETRTVSVVAKKATDTQYPVTNSKIEFSYDEASETNPMTVDVKVTVEGDSPSNVVAFFMRKVNSTQGSREGTISLTPSETEQGVWEGSYTFTTPGEYVLRTVQLDGRDYDLPTTNYPQVSVSGFGISSVTMHVNGKLVESKYETIMTGDTSVNANLTLKFASDQQKLPRTVNMQFLKEDGTQVTAFMSYNSNADNWTGTANFSTSGVYTLRYVIMDGEYTELAADYQKQLDITMGMTVSVVDSGNLRDTIFEDRAITVPMFVRIYNDNGEEVKYLTGVRLRYSSGGSIVDEMSPDLKWNASEGCYTGNIQIPRAGVYTFAGVQVGSNTLTNTVYAPPVYTSISLKTPSYYDAAPMEGMDYLLSTGTNSIEVGVRIKNASAAAVTAVLTDGTMTSGSPTTYEVSVSMPDKNETIKRTLDDGTVVYDDVSTFKFELPDVGGGYRSGDWTIIGLKLSNVFSTGTDGSRIEHKADNPLVWDLSEIEAAADDDLHVKVVNIKYSLYNDTQTENGVVSQIVTDEDLNGGAFMGTATATKPIKVVITDQNGDALDPDYVTISAPTIVYQYQPRSSETYGHYYSATADAEVANVTLTGESRDDKTFEMSLPTFVYAGMYEGLSMKFTVSGENVNQSFEFTSHERWNLDSNNKTKIEMPVYTLSTEKATMTVTGVAPATSVTTVRIYTTATPSNADNMIEDNFYSMNKYTDNSAVVYVYVLGGDLGWFDQEAATPYQPNVSLQLSGVPTGLTSATALLEHGTDSAFDTTFNFTANGTVYNATSGVGGFTPGTSDTWGTSTYPVIYPGGAMEIKQVTVVYKGASYVVDLEEAVTINNPLYPAYLDFESISGVDATFADSGLQQPVRVYSTDDKHITLELPALTWQFPKTGSTTYEFADSDWVIDNSKTVSVYSNYYSRTRSGRNYTYTPYNKVTRVYNASTVVDGGYYEIHTVTAWTINGTVYTAGETITLNTEELNSMTFTATPTVTVTNGESFKATYAGVKTTITYEAQATTSTEPSGNRIGALVDWTLIELPSNSEEVTYTLTPILN